MLNSITQISSKPLHKKIRAVMVKLLITLDQYKQKAGILYNKLNYKTIIQ